MSAAAAQKAPSGKRKAIAKPNPSAWADSADLTLAVVPSFVADFLHQMQAQLIKAADNTPEPGSIVLQPPCRAVRWSHSGTSSSSYDTTTYEQCVRFQRYYQLRSWPAWDLEEDRVDASGARWTRKVSCTVDDFGSLVPTHRGFDEDAIWRAES